MCRSKAYGVRALAASVNDSGRHRCENGDRERRFVGLANSVSIAKSADERATQIACAWTDTSVLGQFHCKQTVLSMLTASVDV